jgi:predicted enzyme related to lactoylglutathione lyase
LVLDARNGGLPSGGGWHAYFDVVGLERVRAQLLAAGVELIVDTHASAPAMLELADPDGNRLCLGAAPGACFNVVRHHHVLAVHDLERTRRWYETVLGCTSEDIDPGNWVLLRACGVTFMVGHCPDAVPPAELGDHNYFAYLVVDDVDAFERRARELDADFIKLARDEPWGMRELGLRTVDGHRIMIGQPIV